MEQKKEEWKELLEEAVLEDSPKKEIQEAQVDAVSEPVEAERPRQEIIEPGPDDYAKKNKKEFLSRLVLIFVLGFLIGIALKTEALKKVTIGYSDYLMKTKPQNYDINNAQKELNKAQATASEAQTPENSGAPNADANPATGNGEKTNQTQN